MIQVFMHGEQKSGLFKSRVVTIMERKWARGQIYYTIILEVFCLSLCFKFPLPLRTCIMKINCGSLVYISSVVVLDIISTYSRKD